jgi:lysophospholipase L1-like esterase
MTTGPGSGGDPFALISDVLASELMPQVRARELSCYVAIGDSFTAGTGASAGEAWADRLAAALRVRNPRLAYRNLAVDGATSVDTAAQARVAIELEPDLVTVICGANDVLRTVRPDPLAAGRRLASIIGRLRAAVPSVRIVTATAPDRWDFVPLGRRTRARVEHGIERLNRVTRGVADAYGVALLDVAGHPGLGEPENFSDDGLHPSALGHARAARAIAALVRKRYGIQAHGL